MSVGIAGLLLAGIALAFANGANDNFKGVATLFGAGVLRYWPALGVATLATLAGSLVALAGGAALVATFSGKGLVPDAIASDPTFMTAVGVGAAVTVLLASWRGLPVSTTHALLGALLGVGLVRAGTAVDAGRLGSVFAVPLLVSPLFAASLAGVLWPAARRLQRIASAQSAVCLCVEQPDRVVFGGATTAALLASAPSLIVDHVEACAARGARPLARGNPGAAMDVVHVVSAAAVSFARGLNDTPKVVPLLLATGLLSSSAALVAVGLLIAVGGVAGARPVAQTMSYRITTLNHAQGLVGNLTTALLVLLASRHGLPVSTTHVACGAIIGIGAASGNVRWGGVKKIALAWVTTLPLAAAFGALYARLL